MDIQYGRSAEAVRRFSRFKWAIAAVLLALLLVGWFMGAHLSGDPAGGLATPGADAGAGSEAGGSSASAPPSFAIDLAPDGSLKVRGAVADQATRSQWLNAIRIGAQGARVADELTIGPVSPAPGWIAQLSSLVAVMREHKLSGLQVVGETAIVKGAVGSSFDKGEIDKTLQAQLPPGYRLNSQLAISALAAVTARTPAGSASSEASDSSSSVAKPPGSASRPDGVTAPGAQRADPERANRRDAGARDGESANKTGATRKPADCPRQIRPLAQSVYFKTDVASISSADRVRLQRLGECLGRARLRIVGHADPRHNDNYNLELSQRRAKAVADAVVAGGAQQSRVVVVAAGKTKPATKGVSREALQRSRRVDIQIR